AGPRGVGVSARCWVLREQAPLFWPSFSRLPCGGGVGVVGGGLLSWAVGVLVGASARVCCGCLAWAWVLCWPWGVCELDSGCEHLDLNDLFCVIGLAGPSWWGVCWFWSGFLLLCPSSERVCSRWGKCVRAHGGCLGTRSR